MDIKIKQIYNLKDELGNLKNVKSFESYKKIYKFTEKISKEIPKIYNDTNISINNITPLEKMTLVKLKDDYNKKDYKIITDKIQSLMNLKPSFVKANNKINKDLQNKQGEIWEASQELLNVIKAKLLIEGFF
jgi:hypothetical protein